jgi:carbamoyltransferase
MYYLGISCWYHDSSAVLLKEHKIICAVQEERFTRIKHDSSFPKNSIQYCLREANISFLDISKIIFYDDPDIKFKRIKKTYLDFFPKSFLFFLKSYPIWFLKKQHWKKNLIINFNQHFKVNIDKNSITNCLHHKSHAASAFYPSKFENAAVLVLDGVGEFDTVSLWLGQKNKLRKIDCIEFPHSLGLFYSAMTSYIGFRVNSGEYKVMGLAPYGEPKFVDIMKKHLIHIDDNGKFSLNMKYFDFATGNSMTNKKLYNLFGEKPRLAESKITQFEMDIACSVQKITEEIMVKLSSFAKKITGQNNLCLAGGVALNCVGNGKILSNKIFKNIWIQPASGDAGGALGCALEYYYEKLNKKRKINENEIDSMSGSYLGPKYKDIEIENYLLSVNANFKKINKLDKLVDDISDEIIEGKIIGWHQNRMEFGPRSLGNRSILGDPRNTSMQSKMNLKIKYRESFRPFAPSVLSEKTNDWFDIKSTSPYMLFVAKIKSSKKLKISLEEKNLFGIDKLKIPKSKIPAVTHVDCSSRIQTVHRETNIEYHSLIEKFYKKTNCPVLINTSFNVRGEPIVCSPEDSYKCFMRTEMDVLVIGNYVLHKENQPNYKEKINWKEEFKLD